ncbi:MAG: dihydroorotate dehydrogenase-like protein [Chthoniobacterales bacterium]|nr:dihydroorotate dehydrogenase-like protein [Chthoniobacterales bacterium]
MDLTTEYLGLKLKNPLIPGASPLVDDLDNVRRLEDAGAPAVVMHSLFEEQIAMEARAEMEDVDAHEYSFAEAATYLPAADQFPLGPDTYLEQIAKIKRTVGIPVIASLNGVTAGGWIAYAKLMQDAGADAIELNTYFLPTDPGKSSADVEAQVVDITRAVAAKVTVPVAVKLSPFFTALPHFVRQLQDAGARGLVLFNRFYQPDLDVEELEVRPTLQLSDPYELRLRLRWLAILSTTVTADLSASGGVHTGLDAIKAVMAGATTVQLVSVLLRQGPGHFAEVLRFFANWLEEHEYASLSQLRGSMNLRTCPDPAAFERANYLKVLQSWGGRVAAQ